MGARGILLALLAGCYGPSISPGSPCTEQGLCPEPLMCIAGRCLAAPDDAAPFDTRVVDAVDSPFDPDAPDAATDAAIDAAVMPDASTGLAWGTPVALGSGVNTIANEGDPSITNDRLTLYFVRPVGGSEEIFVATRPSPTSPFGAATAVAALNSTAADRSPEIAQDGQSIVFTSDRSGEFEIYYSLYLGGQWTIPAVITEFSSAANESDVAISPDRLTALLTRGATGARKVFRATRANLLTQWTAPVEVTELSGLVDPAAPSLTNGASAIYLHANTSRDLFVTVKAGATYPPPSAITELNTTAREAAPFVLQTNDYMLFERAGTIYETSR